MTVSATCTPVGDGTMNCIMNELSDDPVGSTISSGDTAWVLTSTALVLMMTLPAIGFFYGGLASQKNIISTIFMSIICAGIVTVEWNTIGYSFAFGYGTSTWGTWDWAMLRFKPDYQDPEGYYAATIPLSVHSAFQGTFAVITCAIISGSIVGRIKFIPYCLFILLWSIVVYNALACWTWNINGWLHTLGELDFAGGTVVHISSATAGLVACYILGPRSDFVKGETHSAPNAPLVILGAALLWVGWIGFNAGSAVAAGATAGLALINTNTSAAAAMVTWVALDAMKGRISVTGASCGIVVGLVLITPACAFIHPGWALLFGIIGAIAVYYAMIAWRRWANIDDTLDVWCCHGLGGVIGSLMTGLFASDEWGPTNGSFYGNGMQILYQICGIVVAIAWSGCCTAIILFFLKLVCGGLRPTAEEEQIGLDRTFHTEQWDLAMAAAEMVGLLSQKDHIINGTKHKMDGTLQMTYKPNDVTEHEVQVELSVNSGHHHHHNGKHISSEGAVSSDPKAEALV